MHGTRFWNKKHIIIIIAATAAQLQSHVEPDIIGHGRQHIDVSCKSVRNWRLRISPPRRHRCPRDPYAQSSRAQMTWAKWLEPRQVFFWMYTCNSTVGPQGADKFKTPARTRLQN